LVGDDFDVGEIERVFQYIRTNQLIYDILTTVADLMDCVSADRFEAVESVEELQKRAYELNQNKLFLAALNLEDVALKQSSYRLHMDTDNTQPTFESRNRFWFPGPADSMVIDLKYHRGFVQLKQMVDLGIIKYKRNETGFAPEADPLESGRSLSSLFSIKQVDNDEEDDDDFDLSLEGSGAEQATQKVSPLAEDQDSTTMPSEEGGVEVTTEEERVTTLIFFCLASRDFPTLIAVPIQKSEVRVFTAARFRYAYIYVYRECLYSIELELIGILARSAGGVHQKSRAELCIPNKKWLKKNKHSFIAWLYVYLICNWFGEVRHCPGHKSPAG